GLSAVQFHVYEDFVLNRKPEVSYLFIFAHEIRSCDPQRRVPCRMSGNFDDREGKAVDPYSPFEEILILSPWKRFDNETMVDTQILFAQHSEPIVRRGDRAIAML